MVGIYSVGANVRKPDAWVAFSPSRRSGNILSTVDKTIHAFKRRAIGPVFSDRGLQQVEGRIFTNVQRFTARLRVSDEVAVPSPEDKHDKRDGEAWGPEQDMALLCERLAFDVTRDAVDFRCVHGDVAAKLDGMPRLPPFLSPLQWSRMNI